MNNFAYLGMVRHGKLIPLVSERPTRAALRLTIASFPEATSPETAEISLRDHEGLAVLVRGVDSGDWIYAATIVDVAGKIGSIVAATAFQQEKDAGDIFRELLGGR